MDDKDIIAKTQEQLKDILYIMVNSGRQNDMEINIDKSS